MKATTTVALLIALTISACAALPTGPTEAPTRQPAPTPAPTSRPAPTEAPVATEPTTAREPIRLVDGLGREVELEGPAERIVSIVPSNTEIAFAIEAGEQLVGRDEFSDYPEAALEVPSIGNTFGELNVEAIVALDPDLVLVGSITPPEQIRSLEQVGLTVYALTNPTDFEGLFANIEAVGALTGRGAEAAALVDQLRARYNRVLEAVEGAELVSVFYEVEGNDPTAPWTTGTGTFQQTIFDLIAAENIASDIQGWGQLSLEEVVLRDPEVIIFGSGPFVPTTVESLSARPGWAQLSAVAGGRVYGVDTDLLDLPGPRLVDGLERLAEILHPELFDR